MRKFLALLWLNLRAMLSSFRFGGGKKKRAASGVGALVLLAAVGLYISGMYSFLLVDALAPLGMAHLIILLMPVLAVVIGTMYTVFAAQGVVFGGRDNDLMFSLPVSAFALMLSRTLALYLENLVFFAFVMLPAGAAYLIGGGSGGAWFALALVLCTLLLPLLPTLLSLALGFLVSWVMGKLPHKTGFSTVLYLVFFAAVMAGSLRLSAAINDVAAYAAGMQDAFSGWGLPFLLTMRAACFGDIPALLELAALCAAPFLLAVWAFGTRYKRIVTALASHSARSDYRLGAVSASGQTAALLKKEFKRLIGTPVYFLNTGIGHIMALVMSAAALIFHREVAEQLMALRLLGVRLPLLPLATGMTCLLLGMAPTTAVSISLEGKQLWVLKEAPIPVGRVFGVKVGLQLLLSGGVLLISGPLLVLGLDLEVPGLFLFWLAGLAGGLCTALLGLFANLCLPKLDASNDAVVVKQSASMLVSMLASMVLVAAGVGLWWLCRGLMGDDLALLAPSAAFLAGSGGLILLLRSRGERMFLEL